MKRRQVLSRAGVLAALTFAPSVPAAGEQSLFDGKTLTGWRAKDPSYWSVEDGAIVGRSTPDHPCTRNQFLEWTGGPLSDFELTLEFQLLGGPEANSGIQIRSKIHPDGAAEGYQADIDRTGKYLGGLYDEHTPRGFLAQRGEQTEIARNGDRKTVEIGDSEELRQLFRPDGWNEYRIVATGPRIQLHLNGRPTADVIDEEEGQADRTGTLALQLHFGPPTTVRFRAIRLKT